MIYVAGYGFDYYLASYCNTTIEFGERISLTSSYSVIITVSHNSTSILSTFKFV